MSAEDAGLARLEAELARRWPESRLEPSLERMSALVHLLGDPQRACPVVHVAGTNGKTSTARMVESLLHEFGLHTGRTTSPHLHSVTERIAFDGRAVEPQRLAALWEELAPYVALVDARFPQTPLSFFEVVTALAFAGFADAPVDVAVVETGMGGSWDATNVADGQVAVITPVARDHEAYLGSDLELIAEEKAGIVKPGAAVVTAVQDLPVAQVLARRVASVGASLLAEGVDFGIRRRAVAVGGQVVALQGLGGTVDDVFLPLHGAHQAHNAACALAAVESLLGGGREALDAETVRAGFAGVTSPGRLEVVRRSPTVLVDAAHNPHGAAATVAAVEEAFGFTRLVGVVGVLADKDAAGLLAALEPLLDSVVVTDVPSPRRWPAAELAAVAEDVFGPDRVELAPSLADALDRATARAEADAPLGGTGVLVIGSVVLAAAARHLLGADEDS